MSEANTLLIANAQKEENARVVMQLYYQTAAFSTRTADGEVLLAAEKLAKIASPECLPHLLTIGSRVQSVIYDKFIVLILRLHKLFKDMFRKQLDVVELDLISSPEGIVVNTDAPLSWLSSCRQST